MPLQSLDDLNEVILDFKQLFEPTKADLHR
jgi:hypothetical protein